MCGRCHYPRPDEVLRGICSRCGYHGSIWIIERHTLSTLTRWRIDRVCARCIAYSSMTAA